MKVSVFKFMKLPTTLRASLLAGGLPLALMAGLAISPALGQEAEGSADRSAETADADQPERPKVGKDRELAAPVALKGGDELIAVESPGYACPTMADVDGDGKVDLVVGQFAGGKMMYFRNVAETGQSPKFEAKQWLTSGDERAQVPGVW